VPLVEVRIVLSKFLPPIFMDAMRDSPEASVHMFEGTHENPELIWNDESREKVSDVVKKLNSFFLFMYIQRITQQPRKLAV
jgi:DnaJ family protein C protein 13